MAQARHSNGIASKALRASCWSRSLAIATAMAMSMPTALPVRAQTASELPALGDAATLELSAQHERRLGELIMRQIRADPSTLDDPDTEEYLNHLGFTLVSVSPARHMDFEFFAVRDASLNAFALPGGFIGVHTGLVLAAETEAQLASVLAHEIGHVAQRHIARMLANERQTTAITLGTLLLALLAARSGSSSSGQIAQAALIGGQAASVQNQLNFSVDAEREADRVGLQLLTDAHYDPRAAADFFSRMQRGTQLHDSPAAQYRRTHPLTIERMSDMQTRVRELAQHPSRATPDNTTFELIRARLRVLQANTDSGARDAMAYFSARLQAPSASTRAAAHYGMAVAQLRLGQNQEALASAQQAKALTPTTIPMLEKAIIEARFLSGDRAAALEQAQSHAARFPLSRLSALLYAQLLQRHGDHQAALAFMRSQLALTKTQVKYHEIIARSYAALGQNTRAHQATAEAYALMGATPAAIEQLKLAQKAADADFYVLSEIDARLRQLSAQLGEPPSKPLQ